MEELESINLDLVLTIRIDPVKKKIKFKLITGEKIVWIFRSNKFAFERENLQGFTESKFY